MDYDGTSVLINTTFEGQKGVRFRLRCESAESCQANYDVVLSEARERFRLFRLACRIEPDAQEPLISWHLLQNPEQDACSQCGIGERFSPGLQFTPLQLCKRSC